MRYSASLADEVAGVLAATVPLGMPSGKIGHHPGWKPLQGSATIACVLGRAWGTRVRATTSEVGRIIKHILARASGGSSGIFSTSKLPSAPEAPRGRRRISRAVGTWYALHGWGESINILQAV